MNDRVRELIGHIDVNAKVSELAEQSGCKIDKLGYGEGNLEKFAELIVRECAHLIETQDARSTPAPHIYILREFGVTDV